MTAYLHLNGTLLGTQQLRLKVEAIKCLTRRAGRDTDGVLGPVSRNCLQRLPDGIGEVRLVFDHIVAAGDGVDRK